MKSKISIIHLGVRDFQTSLKFYRDGLGFKPSVGYKEGEEYVMFKMEGSMFALFSREKLANDAKVDSNGTGFPSFTLSHNAKSRSEVDDIWQHAVQVGAKPTKKPEPTNWGGYSGYFSDPDGFLWEVAYNPFTDLS